MIAHLDVASIGRLIGVSEGGGLLLIKDLLLKNV